MLDGIKMDDQEKSVRLLSLDGGGIRGLSSLLILKELMKRINENPPPKPCDYFDLIGGTSTGGLIALMLGRLHMGIDECIEKYQQISTATFKAKGPKVDVLRRGKDVVKVIEHYQSAPMIDELKSAANAFEGNEDATLYTTDTTSRV
ncbi:acyl transferase/acyl hydrolase/lysophospholipase [Astrocystis sublimbata]|nr:acyl transferase/acyl hydrolase/lysophospholipase [Astrocystis sublimbata]